MTFFLLSPATVGSFARRLGMMFHSEVEGKAPEGHRERFSSRKEENFTCEELSSTEPLLSPQLSSNLGSLAEHANLQATPVQPRLHTMGHSSPSVPLEEAQVEVTEADLTLEEAEEARESPLHKRLSMSLITCHEGAPASETFVEVHRENSSSPEPGEEVEPLGHGVDHAYALPSVTTEADSPVEPAPTADADDPPAQPEEEEKLPSSEETKELIKESALPPSDPPSATGPEQPQACTGIRCPTFDSKSPSQVVFKPQWLGQSFGPSGLRLRGVQGLSGKRGSSPLAVRVAVKNANYENKGQSGKLKQKGV